MVLPFFPIILFGEADLGLGCVGTEGLFFLQRVRN